MKILCKAFVNTVSLALAIYLVCGNDKALITAMFSVLFVQSALVVAFYAAGFVMGGE